MCDNTLSAHQGSPDNVLRLTVHLAQIRQTVSCLQLRFVARFVTFATLSYAHMGYVGLCEHGLAIAWCLFAWQLCALCMLLVAKASVDAYCYVWLYM